MDDKTKLRILEYWGTNTNKVWIIPEELKDKVTNDEIANLISEINPGGNVGPHFIFQHAERIRKKIKDGIEIKSIELQNKVLQQQTDLQEKLNKIQEEANAIIDKQNKVLWFQVGITFVLILATVFFSLKSVSIAEDSNDIAALQANISKIQTEILQKSNPSFEPQIEIVPNKEDLIIPAWKIVDERDRELDAEQRWAIVSLSIYNLGRTDSQHVSCLDYGEEYGAYFTPDNNFRNIPAGTVNRALLHIMQFDCAAYGICNPENLTLGYHNISLKCTCIGCKTQRQFQSIIDFCVYNKNDSICSEDKIGYKQINMN